MFQKRGRGSPLVTHKNCFSGARLVPRVPPEMLSLGPSPGPSVLGGGPGDPR